MKRKENEVIIKLNDEQIAHLMACMFATLMMSKDDEVRSEVKDLIHTITSQISE